MTPLATRLQLALENEFRRMDNVWFFKWHHIGGDRPIEIDAFDGRSICYSGIRYDGTAQKVYWDTIQRYLKKEIVSRFLELEIEVKSNPEYPPETIERTLNEAQQLLSSFSQRIRNQAIEKDRILSGDGINFPPARDRGHWEGCRAEHIEAQAAEILTLLLVSRNKKPVTPAWYERNKWRIDNIKWLLLFAVAVATVVIAV
jgi:hypothetical protein